MNKRTVLFVMIGFSLLLGLSGCANNTSSGGSEDGSNRFYGASIMGPHRQR